MFNKTKKLKNESDRRFYTTEINTQLPLKAIEQRNWLKNRFSIDESEFPAELAKKVRDYWLYFSDGCYASDPIYCQFYSQATGNFDVRYIPDDFQYWILERDNIDSDYVRAFSDKNYMELLLPNAKMPKSLLHCVNGRYLDAEYNIIDKKQALKILLKARDKKGGFIWKKSISSWGGADICFATPKTARKEIEVLLSTDNCNNFIVQELIQQHPDMAVFNAESVNTIRLITTLLDDNVEIVSAVVRMGANNCRIDNFSSGGVCCGINKNGTLKEYCYSADAVKTTTHPSGLVVAGLRIPSFDEVCCAARKMHYRFPQFGIMSWDFSVDTSGEPVLVEYNVGRGGIHIHQLCNGPLYGDMTESIIRKALSKLDAPEITFAGLNENGKPSLVWEPVIGATGYEVYRFSDKYKTESKMHSTTNTYYTNLSFERGTVYHFYVKAIAQGVTRTLDSKSEIVDISVE